MQEELHGDSIATVLNSGQPGEAVTVQAKHGKFAVMEAKAARRKQKRVIESGVLQVEVIRDRRDLRGRLFLLA